MYISTPRWVHRLSVQETRLTDRWRDIFTWVVVALWMYPIYSKTAGHLAAVPIHSQKCSLLSHITAVSRMSSTLIWLRRRNHHMLSTSPAHTDTRHTTMNTITELTVTQTHYSNDLWPDSLNFSWAHIHFDMTSSRLSQKWVHAPTLVINAYPWPVWIW